MWILRKSTTPQVGAIQFNLNALSGFSNVNFGDNDAIANLGNGNGLVGSS